MIPFRNAVIETLPNGKHRFTQIAKTRIGYPSAEGGAVDTFIDASVARRNNAAFDGWEITGMEWHYRVGMPKIGGLANQDGVAAFGGRRGQNWIAFRLQQFGYLHWPTKVWEQIGGDPTYNRANLSRTTQQLELETGTINIGQVAEWNGLWTTPGGGDVSIRWFADGRRLKEEVQINQAARTWIAANAAPSTPANETFFGALFEVDLIGVSQLVRNQIASLISNGALDIDDEEDGGIEWRDALDNFVAFMPVDHAYVKDANGNKVFDGERKLRKRIFYRNGKLYIMVGLRVDVVAGLPAGNLILDPTFSEQPNETDGADTWMHQSNPTTNYGTETKLAVFEGNDRSAVIRFDLSSIPSSATVTTATLTLYSNFASSNRSNTVYALLVSFVESECTWNNRSSGNAWNSGGGSTAGTDYNATPEDSGTLSSSGGTPTDFDVATSAQSFISGTNYGWMIRDPSDSGYGEWNSANDGTSSVRPKLVIEYTTSITPAAAEVDLSTSDPVVIITIPPAAAEVDLGTSGPTVVLGNITIAPAAAEVDLSTTDPTITRGDITTTPSAAAVDLGTTDPIIVYGGVTTTPAAAEVDLGTTDPTVVLGNVTVTPTVAEVDFSTTDPAIVYGGVTTTPTAAAVDLGTSDPTVVYGGVTTAPTAAEVDFSTSNPTVVLGSVTTAPTAAEVDLSTTDPIVVLGAITPAAAEVDLGTTDPTVILGDVMVTPTAAAVDFSTTNPTVVYGGVITTPTAAEADLGTTDPAVVLGNVTVTTTAAEVGFSTTDPTVSLGVITPEAAEVGFSTTDPTVVLGDVAVTTTAAEVDLSTTDPVIIYGGVTVSPTAAAVDLGTTDPVIIYGGVTVSPTAAVVDLGTTDPAVVLGNVTVTTTAAEVDFSTTDPTVVVADILLADWVISDLALVTWTLNDAVLNSWTVNDVALNSWSLADQSV